MATALPHSWHLFLRSFVMRPAAFPTVWKKFPHAELLLAELLFIYLFKINIKKKTHLDHLKKTKKQPYKLVCPNFWLVLQLIAGLWYMRTGGPEPELWEPVMFRCAVRSVNTEWCLCQKRSHSTLKPGLCIRLTKYLINSPFSCPFWTSLGPANVFGVW